MATAKAKEDTRVTRQFRIDLGTWDEFAQDVGYKNASPIVRRLIARYLTDDVLRRKIAKTEDPSPDRRLSGVE